MILGYNTNGLTRHDYLEALELLASTGYGSVAISVDHGFLNPFSDAHRLQTPRVRHFLKTNGFTSCIETNPRFLLDPCNRSEPSLMESDAEKLARRIEYYQYCIDLAAELGSYCVTLSSGVKPEGLSFNLALEHLVRNLAPVLRYAEDRQVDIGFHPNPEMLIDTTGRFERLRHLVDSPRLKLTLDIGQLFFKSEIPIAEYIDQWKDVLVNVHLSDMRSGSYRALAFGEGQIYFPPILESLRDAGYHNGLQVTLENYALTASDAVRESYEFLAPILNQALTENR